MNKSSAIYIGKDLESMSFAVNYHKWILDEFRPFLGKHLVEVGAGRGNFSELLLPENPKNLILVEPSGMLDLLRETIIRSKTDAEITFYPSVFAHVAEEIAAGDKPDSIIYVNVLEHIEEDSAELEIVHRTLKTGGRCFIFVPAFMSLYGEFDRQIGHYRRYAKKEIEEKCRAAGFKILKSKYFDLAGIFPWYIKYKLLRSDSLESRAVTLYDRVVVPFAQKLEKIFPVPAGKNILIVVEK